MTKFREVKLMPDLGVCFSSSRGKIIRKLSIASRSVELRSWRPLGRGGKGKRRATCIRDVDDGATPRRPALSRSPVVVLRPDDWAHWIYLTKPQRELLRPLPEGSLEAKTIREGSDKTAADGPHQMI